MTKQQLEDKLNAIAQQVEDQIVAAKEFQTELKEVLSDLENIDLEELELEPKTTNTTGE